MAWLWCKKSHRRSTSGYTRSNDVNLAFEENKHEEADSVIINQAVIHDMCTKCSRCANHDIFSRHCCPWSGCIQLSRGVYPLRLWNKIPCHWQSPLLIPTPPSRPSPVLSLPPLPLEVGTFNPFHSFPHLCKQVFGGFSTGFSPRENFSNLDGCR